MEDIFLYKAKFPKYAAPEIDVEVHSKLKGGRKRTLGPMFFNYNIKNLKVNELIFQVFYGSSCWTRTNDLSVNSRALYQLS